MIERLIEQTRFDNATRVVCPFCGNDRKKKNFKDMTLTRKADGAVIYHCHHCDASGLTPPKTKERILSAVPSIKILSNALRQEHYDFLMSRGITKETADKAKLFSAEKFFSRIGKQTESIGFPYYRDGALAAAKYRSIESKDFTQDAGGAHDFFGLSNITKGDPIIIVEGEMDCLTAMQCGVNNVLSVPSGAPIKVADGKVLPSEDKKFAYVWNAREVLEAAPYVVLATDQDGPGQALAEELARRIGKEKCKLAKFDRKDLNEVLMLDDPARVVTVINDAQAYPVNGINEATAYKDKINDLFAKGTGKGCSTGYASVDNIYTVAPAQMTVVTGYPSSGKSNVVDQFMVNLARTDDWKFAICSFENQPDIHITRLMEIYTRKQFFDGREKMGQEEMDRAFKWVNEHFFFLDNNGDEPNSLDSILSRARVLVKRIGIRGLVIDPYNYIEMDRTSTETEAISAMLTKVKKFCTSTDVHTWFVAHPSKINRSGVEQPRPDGMSISGSMAWWAKTDCGLTVHRGTGAEVQIAVWKCRYRWVGTQGETTLLFNKTAGIYTENLDAF
jgi:twinkle protein